MNKEEENNNNNFNLSIDIFLKDLEIENHNLENELK